MTTLPMGPGSTQATWSGFVRAMVATRAQEEAWKARRDAVRAAASPGAWRKKSRAPAQVDAADAQREGGGGEAEIDDEIARDDSCPASPSSGPRRASGTRRASVAAAASGRRVLFPLGRLPADAVYHVCRFLAMEDLAAVRSASRAMRDAVAHAVEAEFEATFGEHPAARAFSMRTTFRMLGKVHAYTSRSVYEVYLMCAARGLGRYMRHVVRYGLLPRGDEAGAAADEEAAAAVRRPRGLNSLNRGGLGAVHLAAMQGHVDVLQMMLEAATCDVGAVSRSGRHATHYAAQKGRLEALEWLLRRAPAPGGVDAPDREGLAPVHLAAAGGHTAAVRALLAAGAAAGAAAGDGRTPLYMAADAGHARTARELVEAGGDVLAVCDTGKSALYAAAEGGHTEVVSLLLEAGADPRKETCRQKIALYAAAEQGHVGVTRVLLEVSRVADLFCTTVYGTTPMYICGKAHHKIRRLFYIYLIYSRRLRSTRRGIPMTDLDDAVLPARVLKIKAPMLIEELERFHKDVDAAAYELPAPRPMRTALKTTGLGTVGSRTGGAADVYVHGGGGDAPASPDRRRAARRRTVQEPAPRRRARSPPARLERRNTAPAVPRSASPPAHAARAVSRGSRRRSGGGGGARGRRLSSPPRSPSSPGRLARRGAGARAASRSRGRSAPISPRGGAAMPAGRAARVRAAAAKAASDARRQPAVSRTEVLKQLRAARETLPVGQVTMVFGQAGLQAQNLGTLGQQQQQQKRRVFVPPLVGAGETGAQQRPFPPPRSHRASSEGCGGSVSRTSSNSGSSVLAAAMGTIRSMRPGGGKPLVASASGTLHGGAGALEGLRGGVETPVMSLRSERRRHRRGESLGGEQ